MSSETFLGLNSIAWTALATILALSLAVCPVAIRSVRDWWTRPDLEFDTSETMRYSGWISGPETGSNGRWYVRVPVYNRSKSQVANNVEVLIKEVKEYQTIPMRLRWAHTAEATAARIPPETFRLLDVACFELSTHSDGVRFAVTGEAGEREGRVPACAGMTQVSITLELFVSANALPTKRVEMKLELTGPLEPYISVAVT